MFEDLGVQMSLHSTLSSYLEKLLWLLAGSFGIPGGQYVPTSIVNLAGAGQRGRGSSRVSPVAGARIISGLVPCNVIAEEILTDHPDRYRAMLVESGNPAHSLADSRRMREALGSLDLLVVIDVAMTETARLADYVLPASSQYEKWESTFFNFEFPENVFHLRRPLLDPLPGTLGRAGDPRPPVRGPRPAHRGRLRAAASGRRAGSGRVRRRLLRSRRRTSRARPARAGRALPHARTRPCPTARPPRPCCGAPATSARSSTRSRSAEPGFDGEGLEAGEQLFDAVLSSPSGLVFSVDEAEVSWSRLTTDDGRVHLAVPEMLAELAGLASEAPPAGDPAFPFVLSAGERRSFTANTIFRDPSWRKRDPGGSLRVSPADAAGLGVGRRRPRAGRHPPRARWSRPPRCPR